MRNYSSMSTVLAAVIGCTEAPGAMPYTLHLKTKHFVTILIYIHRVIEGCIFSLINMPLIAMRAGQYMSIYVVLH